MSTQMSTVYGLQQTRITLYDTAGAPTQRFILQVEQKEGLEIAFEAEGTNHQLGSGAAWARRWVHRGFRAALGINWDLGMESKVQTWTGSAWGALGAVSTAQALGLIISSAMLVPCKVEPHYDLAFSFQAQPDPGQAFSLTDLSRVVHRGLRLNLISTGLVPNIPDWPVVNDYFAAGYIADGFIEWVP